MSVAASGGEDLRAIVPKLTERAAAHQKDHVVRLRAAIGAPRARASAPIWRALGVKATDADAQRDYLSDAWELLELLQAKMAGVEAGIESPMRNSKERESLKQAALERVLGEYLRAGDPGEVRLLLDAINASPNLRLIAGVITKEAMEPRRIVAAARLARAAEHGNLAFSPLYDGFQRDPIERRERLLARIHAGDASEIAARGRDRTARSVETVQSAADALAVTRAMLRHPTLYAHEIGLNSSADDLDVRIGVTAETLAQMHTEATMAKHALGWLIRDDSASPAGVKRQVSVELRYAFKRDERWIRLAYVADLGKCSHVAMREGRWVGEALEAAGAEGLNAEDMTVVCGYGLREPTRTGVACLEEPERLRLQRQFGDRIATVSDVQSVVGVDRCSHRGGEWRTISFRDASTKPWTPAYAALGCPTCLRTRIAVMPLHRFPQGHPLRALIDEDAPADREVQARYVRQQRFYDALTGTPDATGLDELIARDRTINPAPEHYATGMGARRGRQMRALREMHPRR